MKWSGRVTSMLVVGLVAAVSRWGPGLFFARDDNRWLFNIVYWALQPDSPFAAVFALAVRPVLVSIPFALTTVVVTGNHAPAALRSPARRRRLLAALRLSALSAISVAVCLVACSSLGVQHRLLRSAARLLLGFPIAEESSGWFRLPAFAMSMVSAHLAFIVFAAWTSGRLLPPSHAPTGGRGHIEGKLTGASAADASQRLFGVWGRVGVAVLIVAVGCLELGTRGPVLFKVIEEDRACEEQSIFVVLNPLRDRSIEEVATMALAARRARDASGVARSLASIESSAERQKVADMLGLIDPRGWRICGLEVGSTAAEVCLEVAESDSTWGLHYISLRRDSGRWQVREWISH